MDMTKYIVERMMGEITGNFRIIPIYNVKTADISRGDYIFVYTMDRSLAPASIGGMDYWEDVRLVVDVRCANYDSYLEAKKKVKAFLHNHIRGFSDIDCYLVEMTREDELSDKQRGLFRFVIDFVLYRHKNFVYDVVLVDDFNIVGAYGFVEALNDDFEIVGMNDDELVLVIEDDFGGGS